MPKRVASSLAVALVAAGMLVLPAVAGSDATARTQLVRLLSITTSERTNDVAPPGPSKGDTWFSSSRLLNAAAQFGRPKGAAVGTDKGTMTLQGPRAATVDFLTRLPRGTIRVRGRVGFPTGGGILMPVAGGTGSFAGARGTVHVYTVGAQTFNVYRLALPAA